MEIMNRQVGIKDEPTPGGNFELIQEFERRLRRADASFAQWRMWAKKYYDTYASDPWPDGVKETMEAEGRPPVNFNYSLSTLNAVIGQDMADRREAQFQAQSDDYRVSFLGDLYTRLLRHVYKRSKGHRQESVAFYDDLVTGYGWAEGYVDASRFPFRVCVRHVDCLEMLVDPDYREDNCSDARYVIRRKKWSLEDAEAKWPDKVGELRALSTAVQESDGAPRVVHANNYAGPGTEDADTDTDEPSVLIYDYQRRKKVPFVVVDDPRTGEPVQMKRSEFDAWKKAAFAEKDQTTGQPLVTELSPVYFAKDVFERAYFAGGAGRVAVVLSEPAELPTEMFTYRAVTGFRRKETASGRTKHFGLMSLIYEPQLWSSKSLSAIVEMLARAGKGGGFIRKDALDDPQAFIDGQAIPGKWWLLNDSVEDAKKAIVERDQVAWPQAMEQILRIATEGIPYLSAVTDWVKGTARQERSNVLISNLQQQSLVVLNPIFDPLSQFRVDIALLLGRLIQKHMSPDEIDRVLKGVKAEGITYQKQIDQNTMEEVEVPIMVQDGSVLGGGRPITASDLLQGETFDLFEFDITVDLGQASTTAKQAIWQMSTNTAFVQEVMKTMPQVAARFVPFLIANMPGLPAETARTMSSDIQKDMEAQLHQGTVQGVLETLQTLDPQSLQQIAVAATQTLQAQMAGPQGQPQPGAAPPAPAQ